jgi:hypothetical protein
MYLRIRNKVTQFFNDPRTRATLISGLFILLIIFHGSPKFRRLIMYLWIRNKVTQFFNSPRARATLIFGLFILLIIFYAFSSLIYFDIVRLSNKEITIYIKYARMGITCLLFGIRPKRL